MKKQIGMIFLAETAYGGGVDRDAVTKGARKLSRHDRNVFLLSVNIAKGKSDELYILLGDILHDFLCRILHNDSSFSFLKNEKDVCKRVKGCLCETSLFELL